MIDASNSLRDGWPTAIRRVFFRSCLFPTAARSRGKRLAYVGGCLGFWIGFSLALTTTPASAAVRVDLDGAWRFRTDPLSLGANYDPSSRLADTAWQQQSRRVDVPHTWAIGPDHAFHGVGWYFKTFDLSPALAHQHVELNFAAAFSTSKVWVNGLAVGGHVGGFTAYALDISKAVRAGENRIAVAIDDRPGFATVPGYALRLKASGSVAYDWQPNGGLVRDVWLNIGEGGLIRRQALSSVLTTDAADIADRVIVQNISSEARTYGLRVTAYAPSGAVAAQADGRLALGAGQTGEQTVALKIAHPELWNIAAAKLYSVEVELRNETGQTVDRRSDTYGLRKIEIRDRRLYVNGVAVRLTGLTRHEDSPAEGLAETRGTIRRDFDDLAALHTTLTRPVHYPQAAAVLDAADRAGMLLIPEVPVWQMSEAQLRDPRLIAAAQQMMTEMIAQDANHPSIMAWSICNESDASTPGGEAYVKTLKALINRLDPGRFVSFADADISAKPWKREAVMGDVDFIMANAYFGTWSGAESDVGPWLDYMDKTYPTKLVIISEFGWPGPFSKDSETADKDRIGNMRSQLAAFNAAPFVGGAIFWTYQDYRSSRNLWPGQVDGYVDHGVVDQFRQRRPSYSVWQDLNEAVNAHLGWRMGADGPQGFSLLATPKTAGALPSYPLIGYGLRWRVVGSDGAVLDAGEAPLDLAGPATFAKAWTGQDGRNGAHLTLDILTPAGVRAGGGELDYRPLRFGFAPFDPDNAKTHTPETRH
jgi:beta-galactosidase/beta-glucuronidase